MTYEELLGLLEEKRCELNQNQTQFSKTLGLTNSQSYTQIKSDGRKIKLEDCGQISKVLDVPKNDVVQAVRIERSKKPGVRKGTLNDLILTGDDLRYLADVADRMDNILPLNFLVLHLNYKPKE